MKKITVRIDDNTYDKLSFLSKEKGITINKMINLILSNELDIYKHHDFFVVLNDELTQIKNEILKFRKKQSIHYDLSVQHFVNQGYFENADSKKDKCYNELLNKNKDKFNA